MRVRSKCGRFLPPSHCRDCPIDAQFPDVLLTGRQHGSRERRLLLWRSRTQPTRATSGMGTRETTMGPRGSAEGLPAPATVLNFRRFGQHRLSFQLPWCRRDFRVKKVDRPLSDALSGTRFQARLFARADQPRRQARSGWAASEAQTCLMAGSRSLRNSFEFCWGGSGLYDSPLERSGFQLRALFLASAFELIVTQSDCGETLCVLRRHCLRARLSAGS